MKTAIIYEQVYSGEPLYFYVIEGDYRHLDNVYVGLNADAKEDELVNLLYTKDEEGSAVSIPTCTREEFAEAIKDDALLITCGWTF